MVIAVILAFMSDSISALPEAPYASKLFHTCLTEVTPIATSSYRWRSLPFELPPVLKPFRAFASIGEGSF